MPMIGYARCSTKDQNTDMQLDALKSAGCEKIFVESASGADRYRPEMSAALGHLRPGDTLAVWKLDRLARSLSHLVEVLHGLERNGCKFRSLTEPHLCTDTPGGRLVFHIFASLAEFERELIRERVTAGIAAKRAKTGGAWGKKPQLAGREGEVAEMRSRGLTGQQIAASFGVSRATLYRLPEGKRYA